MPETPSGQAAQGARVCLASRWWADAPVLVDFLSWTALAVAFASTALILCDIYGRGYRLKMPVMEAVWPVTALYFGPVAFWAYRRFGAPTSRKWLTEHQRNQPPDKPGWATIAVGVSHCGAGCTLGDIIVEFAVFRLGLTLADTALPFEYVGGYILAVALGIVFQYFAIAPMRGLGLLEGLKAAAKADVLSLTAFEVGLFGWMALMAFVFYLAPHHLHPRLLVPDADRHDHRLRHRLARQHLAHPTWHLRSHVAHAAGSRS